MKESSQTTQLSGDSPRTQNDLNRAIALAQNDPSHQLPSEAAPDLAQSQTGGPAMRSECGIRILSTTSKHSTGARFTEAEKLLGELKKEPGYKTVEHLSRESEGFIFLVTLNDGSKIIEKLTRIENLQSGDPSREVTLGTKLKHDNLYVVLDEKSYLDHTYWSTRSKYVEGDTLKERVARDGNLSPTDAISYMKQVLNLLKYLHDKDMHRDVGQIIHKDLKPSNIILGPDNKVTVIDLGIARSVGHTQTFSLQGSEVFAAPEQLLSGRVTHVSDIYSLGRTMVFALLGEGFESMNGASEKLQYTIPDDAPIPRALRLMLQKMISLDPKDRYPSAESALVALKQVENAINRGDSTQKSGILTTLSSATKGLWNRVSQLLTGITGWGRTATELKNFLDDVRVLHSSDKLTPVVKNSLVDLLRRRAEDPKVPRQLRQEILNECDNGIKPPPTDLTNICLRYLEQARAEELKGRFYRLYEFENRGVGGFLTRGELEKEAARATKRVLLFSRSIEKAFHRAGSLPESALSKLLAQLSFYDFSKSGGWAVESVPAILALLVEVAMPFSESYRHGNVQRVNFKDPRLADAWKRARHEILELFAVECAGKICLTQIQKAVSLDESSPDQLGAILLQRNLETWLGKSEDDQPFCWLSSSLLVSVSSLNYKAVALMEKATSIDTLLTSIGHALTSDQIVHFSRNNRSQEMGDRTYDVLSVHGSKFQNIRFDNSLKKISVRSDVETLSDDRISLIENFVAPKPNLHSDPTPAFLDKLPLEAKQLVGRGDGLVAGKAVLSSFDGTPCETIEVFLKSREVLQELTRTLGESTNDPLYYCHSRDGVQIEYRVVEDATPEMISSRYSVNLLQGVYTAGNWHLPGDFHQSIEGSSITITAGENLGQILEELIKLNMSGYKLEKSTWDSFRREWEALYSPREMTIPKN